MLTATDDFKNMLRQSHQAMLRVRLYNRYDWFPDPELNHLGDLSVIDGSLTMEMDAFIRRSATLRIANDRMFVNGMDSGIDVEGYLNPRNCFIGIDYGIQYAWSGEFEYIRVAFMRVDDVRLNANGDTIEITALDLLSWAKDALILSPWRPVNGDGSQKTVVNAVKSLVEGCFPSNWTTVWHVDPAIDTDLLTSKNTIFSGSRIEAINDLLDQLDARMFCRPNGSIEISPIPEIGPVEDSVWTFDAGVNGVLVDNNWSDSTDGRYNAVAVSFAAGTEDKPKDISVFIYDNRPFSETKYGGSWGKRILQKDVSGLGPITELKAKQIAKRILEKYMSDYYVGTSVTAVYNPLLEPGDQVVVDMPTSIAYPDPWDRKYLINRISIPLAAGPMTVECFRPDSASGIDLDDF